MNNLKISLAEKKIKNPYKVRSLSQSTKDIDLNKRVVTGLFNSYFFIDSDLDMLITGAAKKSISEKGIGSKKGNKIKHLKDHDWTQVTARLDVLDERSVLFNGKQIQGIYHESFYPSATDSNDLLIKIQEKLYDARSIGFRYIIIELAEKDSEDKVAKSNWDMFYPMALNPEVADEFGFFFVVKEIDLFEGSDVAFGSNRLTPMLGTKAEDKKQYLEVIESKLNIIDGLFKKGNMSDDGFHALSMEMLQLKQHIKDLSQIEPLTKYTQVKSRMTQDTQNELIDFYKHLKY